MGNDGGSIPGRAELVRPKKKEIRVESELVANFRAKYCALTKERLRKPVAACKIGYLYNHDSLLKGILDKTIPQELKHVRKMKNFKQINVAENSDKNNEFPFVCPISQTSLNGKNKFFMLWECACVFNEKIIRDLGIKMSKCPLCGSAYSKSQMIELCPTNEEAEIRKARLYQEMEKKERHHEKQNLEKPVQKKVCTEETKKNKPTLTQNKLQALQNQEELTNNDIYKSLFHSDYKLEDNLFTRNVRFGNR